MGIVGTKKIARSDVTPDVDVEDITEFDFDDVEDVREEEGCGCFFCWFVVVWTELLLTLELEDLPGKSKETKC